MSSNFIIYIRKKYSINPNFNNTMKSLLFFLGLLIPLMVFAQNESGENSFEPEFSGNIVFVDNGVATPLEKQKASASTKVGASVYITGVGKATGYNIVKGVKSPVRINRANDYEFIIRVKDNTIDPREVVSIFKLEQKIHKKENKSFRFLAVSDAGTFSGSKSLDIDYISFNAKKYGESSFIISIDTPLESGEYAITLEDSRGTFNMFGIE